eukprot:gene6437-biopygen1611
MSDQLIAAEQIGQLHAQLEQASIANSALTEQFMTKVSAKDAEVADLVQRLAVSSAATDAALANGNPTERQELLNSHYFLGKDLAKSRKALADLQAACTGRAAIAKSAMDVLCTELAAKETALEATQADLAQSQAEIAPVLAENARLTEVVAQLTRENIAYGKRPMAAPAAASTAALTQADVLAMIAAHQATVARNETVPMDTEDPGCSSSGAAFHGVGNGRTVGRKHALPQAAREDDAATQDAIAARKQAFLRGREVKASPTYAKAAKSDGLLYYHSADHPVAPYADAKLAAHMNAYADSLLLDCDPESIVDSLQAVEDLRDSMTRLYTASKMRKQRWMELMPLNIKDIADKDAALKGTKLKAHYPAAEANDDKMDETLPRAPDRQALAHEDKLEMLSMEEK